jgi:hypothetical protein
MKPHSAREVSPWAVGMELTPASKTAANLPRTSAARQK